MATKPKSTSTTPKNRLTDLNGAIETLGPESATWRLEHDARYEQNANRKREILAKARVMRDAMPDRDAHDKWREYETDEHAETRFLIQPLRDSLIAWAEREATVGHWEMWQFENGEVCFELRVTTPDGNDPVVRLMITNQGN